MDGKKKKYVLKIVIEIIIVSVVLVFLMFFMRKFPFFAPYLSLINRILFIVVVLVVAFFISRITAAYVNRTLKVKKGMEKTPELFNKIIMIATLIIAIIIILHYFNIKVTPLLAALGIAGLAIGLALQPTLSNFFSGLLILSERQIRIGDHVELEGTGLSGYVEDIGWRATRVRTLPNNRILIPNSKLIESTITNHWSPDKEMAALVQVGIDYGSDLKKVEKITVDVARKIQKTVEGAVEDFEPFIRYHTFADSNINFTVILRVKEFVDKYLVTHEFIKALKERYDKEDIEISWPIRKITDMDKPKRR